VQRTVEAQERREFWCIVALMSPNSVPILMMSEDCSRCELLPETDWLDCGGDRVWMRKYQPGVYRLKLRPWSHGPDIGGEYSGGVDAASVTQLYLFKPEDLS